ncbi:uncharacterized protein LOC141730041 [Zonotrichia albicollis]|uniref:uncharacterized protein LOC141730041 n=1 Tax=Zonotrichia albicollis TaxID=44394 RepID=UPI003D80BC72
MAYVEKLVNDSMKTLGPFIKTEYNYINDEDMDPHITTKQTPFSATELAKLKKEFGRLPHESETEYVFRVSLTGGDQIKLTEQEASGYWGHGVFLTTGDKRDAWSLTQRAAYWAGGINPLERGDPLAIATTPDQILESVQKAACLQMIHEKKLIRGFESPMQLPVKPEIMTPLIRGLPETLKSTAITIQKTVMALSPIDRLERFLNNSTDQSDSSRKIWTWSEVAVDLINYCRQYGPRGFEWAEPPLEAEQASPRPASWTPHRSDLGAASVPEVPPPEFAGLPQPSPRPPPPIQAASLSPGSGIIPLRSPSSRAPKLPLALPGIPQPKIAPVPAGTNRNERKIQAMECQEDVKPLDR